MRVLVFCEYPSLNGGERSLLEVARRVASPELHVTVAAPARGALADVLRNGPLLHHPLELRDDGATRLPGEEARRRIADCIAATKPQVVHANSVAMSRLVGPVTASLSVPSIGHLRDIMRVSKAAIGDLNRHDRLLAVSQATRQWYVDAGVSAERAEVAYNGVDTVRFQPRPAAGRLHRQLHLEEGFLLVGTVGQLGMRKGVDLFVEAAAGIAARHYDVHFLHVGRRYSQKEEAIAFEQQVRQSAGTGALAGRFHFLGVRDDVERVLNELDVYVHAARQEPLGRVLLEAGASGNAIVATDVGGTREIFPAADRAALIVPPESTAMLCDAVECLLSDAPERRRMGQRARRRVRSVFDADAASRHLAAVYRAAATSPLRRKRG